MMNRYVIWYYLDDGYWLESTFDKDGREISYKNSSGFWSERTYDSRGNILSKKSGYD